jgi:hypothetical protein
MAQVGMDTGYNTQINSQAQAQAQAQAAANSQGFAATGGPANTTAPNAWQDVQYVQNQQYMPGTLQAPLQTGPFGTASTYVGNSGQFLRGQSAALGKALPQTQLGLNAINGGYFGLAAPADYSGGFSGGMPSFTSPYPILPPTSTSIDVELNNVQ